MTDDKFICVYCNSEKSILESSREHSIPQFLGGNLAPNKYKIKNVCKTCNNNLGNFVDASFAKSWIVTKSLSDCARQVYTGNNDIPIPLICMGITKIPDIIIKDDYISEYWLGPSAELIFWIRPDSTEKISYTGGDPIKNKKSNSTAYLTLNSDNLDRIEMVIKSFFNKFKNNRIRKIICCKIEGETTGTLFEKYGFFDEPNEEENYNISSINLFAKNGIKSSINIKENFDYRFIGKMIISTGYSIFGECFLKSVHYQEARKCIYPNEFREFKIKGIERSRYRGGSARSLEEPFV
jgi:hypothetical protein